MLVSALLTSVGINSGLCVLFFVLYSILRKQPVNIDVYAPRALAEGNYKRSSRFNLDRLLPSPGWVKRAWSPSEEQILSSASLDAVVFLRIIIFSLRIFLFAGIIGIFVLLPVNCSGNNLEEFDFSSLSSYSLDVFSISNIKNGSKRLWVHFCAVYLVTVFVCFQLHYEYNYIALKRVAYFYSTRPQPHQFTILVRSIPVPSGFSVSDSVETFFREYYPSTYLSHVTVHHTNNLRKLVNDAKKLYKKVTKLQSQPDKKKYRREHCWGLCGRKVDLVDKYQKKLEDVEEKVRAKQSEASLAREELRAAFVSFKSRYDAAIAFHLQQSINPTRWVTEQAPEPRDVYWPFFSATFFRRWISKLVVIVACILLTVLFLIPVFIVQGLTNLDQLEVLFPFLKSILSITFVSEVITGYLPSLILQLFLKAIPPVMRLLTCIQGYISFSEIDKSACSKVLWFTIWNIFFANVLSGSVLNQISILLEPKNIPSKLAVAVPAQASFFIAYVVTSGWTSTASELFRIIPLICSLVQKPFVDDSEEEFEAPAIGYHKDIPRLCFFGLLGITYFFLAPLILPFLLIYFCLAYIIYRNQFLNVYDPKYETGGRFWTIVHNSTIFSLVLMHILAVGIFTLKSISLASTLVFPLPVLTLLFNEYCRKRFLPIFIANNVESLIKKDREDKNDPVMPEFLNNLVTAYQDPALLPTHYSSNTNSHTAPLLSSAEV